jgi:GNAT superfamily N-acetyltransferase
VQGTVIRLDRSHFDAIADVVGDTPFTVTPYFFLQRRACDVYADAPEQPRYGVVIPHTPSPDAYVFGAASLEATEVERLAAAFLYRNYGTPAALLAEGLAFGVFQDNRLVSMAASLVLTPKHCDVGVYTLRRYRSRGYATDCVEALFAHILARGVRPLWRIGVRQKVAIYFAEKLELDEVGIDGQEVYLQARPVR